MMDSHHHISNIFPISITSNMVVIITPPDKALAMAINHHISSTILQLYQYQFIVIGVEDVKVVVSMMLMCNASDIIDVW